MQQIKYPRGLCRVCGCPKAPGQRFNMCAEHLLEYKRSMYGEHHAPEAELVQDARVKLVMLDEVSGARFFLTATIEHVVPAETIAQSSEHVQNLQVYRNMGYQIVTRQTQPAQVALFQDAATS